MLLLGVGLSTPPKVPTAGLQCGLWRGQETGHSIAWAQEEKLGFHDSSPDFGILTFG
jgi:hypothetical protein